MRTIQHVCLRRLRKRAAHCRKLAEAAYSSAVAQELLTLAVDLEKEADQLERSYRLIRQASALSRQG